MPEGVNIHPARAQAGDKIILSGAMAVHGIAIMSVREGLEFETEIASDTAALNGLVQRTPRGLPRRPRPARSDARRRDQRGDGDRAVRRRRNAFCTKSAIPISEEVKGACEILGLDPLYVANEGKLIAIVPPDDAEAALAAMRKHSLGKDAAIIGEVVSDHPGFVIMKTRVGGMRVVDMLSGEQLPRIC